MKTQEQLIESKLFDHHPMGIVVLNSASCIEAVNQAFLDLLGLDQNKIIGSPFYKLILPEDHTSFSTGLVDLDVDCNVHTTREIRLLVDRDQHVITRLMIKRVNEAFEKEFYLINVQDITDQKHRESTLKETVNHWTQIFQGSPMSIAILDPLNFSIIEANKSTETLLGYSHAELLRINPMDISPTVQSCGTSSVNKALDLVGEVFAGGKPFFEWQLKNKQGRVLDLEICIDRLTLDGRPVIVTMASDISLRKKQATELRESEARFRKFFHNNPLMIFAIDQKGIVLSVNRAVRAELGYQEEELLGKNVEIVFHPEDKIRIKSKIQKVNNENKPKSEWELRKVTKEGKIVWVKEMLRNIEWPDGRSVYLVSCENITARKTAEIARKRIEARYRSVFDNHLFGLMVIDENGMIVIANPALGLLLGYDQTQLAQMHWTGIIHADDHESCQDLITSLLRNERSKVSIEQRYIHKTGHLIDVRCNARMIDTPHSNSILVVVQDISGEKALMEKELQLTKKQSELDHKNRELTTYTLFITEKNRLLSQLSDEIQQILPATYGGARKRMQKLEKNIIRHITNESDWKGFLAHFEEVNPDFLDTLSSRYPLLTQKELKHCAYIRMRLSVADVAAFLHISAKAVEVARYRIKKKLGLESRYQKLSDFLENLT